MWFPLSTFPAFFQLTLALDMISQVTISPPREANLHVPDSKINEFTSLLYSSKIGPETWYNNNTDFGTTRDWLAKAKDSWLDLDWRNQEDRINSFPNFNTTINDVDIGPINIHFVGLYSSRRDALPLLFLHGWPGSFLECLPMLDVLKSKYTTETLPYHVIIPSLPDYGLSGGLVDTELTLEIAARLMNELMITLGFGSGYVAQGGDIGSFLARIISATYPQCKAFHINMLAPSSQEEMLTTANITEEESQHVQRMLKFSATGSSYLLEHGLRPSTIGLVLSSSPLAMLAWIGEKFLEWPDSRYPLTLDTILTMVSFYWYTDTFQRSMYPYRALAGSAAADEIFSVPTSKEKPFGYSVFPAENILLPKAWAEKAYPNLVFYKRNDKGGHFAALEQPNTFLQNVEEFLAIARPLIRLE
ncbi:epoxide hydrolase [Colletotrichum higginsianum]|uniref:Epoxide hydrolase n=1 Tax=Colletotrichum higginsianum (strain IMI 349063) TaxID=759273 RepID=H1V6A5_COLHI|nr:Epoxide hydrolase [Colletotrichum higginsianum IMI 349063]OBR08083.1 Epoxide hydrolase [Colletotrichum higginsianum IMI 349063]CCF35757.1 epoxide hydrolase [Colletotrichum higginsianum]